MPKKATFEDVKKFLKENDINNECTLLSTEYINSSTPLELKCNLCGRIFERDFSHIKRGRFKCPDCGRKSGGGSNKFSIDNVKKYLQENDINHECTLLSTEYINNSEPLKFRCNICGREFERDFNHVSRGRFKCPECGMLAGAKKLVYTKEDVAKNIYEKRKYVMIGPYMNAATPFLVKCEKGHTFYLIYSNFLIGQSGCKECANLALRGSGHPNWKNGGHQETTNVFRHYLDKWKEECLKTANYKCDITGRTDNLVIHHLYNFSNILKETLSYLNLPLYDKISKYSEEEKDSIRLELLKRHPVSLGVVLNKEVHQKFHKEYGLFNNTPEQYKEFKEKYYQRE